MRTNGQHATATEVQNITVQQHIRYYHAIMHAAISVLVVVDSENDHVFIYNDYPRESMKANDSAYYGFKKDVGVD